MNCLKKVSLKPPGGRDSAPPARIPLRVSQGSTCIQSLPSTQSAVVPRAHYHAIASAALALALVCSPAAMAVDENAQGAFSMKCAGCHMNGGNVLAAGASLFPEDLKKNGVADSESMFNLIYKGKGKMPGYGVECAPKGQCTFGPRSSDEDIKGLVAYVMERAEAGWK